MHDILVLGGSGFVGRSVCEKLVERSGGANGRIVVPTRHLARARHVQLLPTVYTVEADVHDDAQLARLVAGRDAVINLVAILHGSEGEFQRVHVDLPRRLAAACKAGGVRRLLHVSALGADPAGPSRYLRSKGRGEAVLREAGLDLTIFRPSVIFGADDRFLNLFAKLQGLLPVMALAGTESRFQPVWVDDVAAGIVRALDRPETIGQVIECAGPEVLTLRRIVEIAGTLAGHPRPVVALPSAIGRLQAALMELAPGEPLMSRDNLDSMRTPNVASGRHPGLESLGVTPSPMVGVAASYIAPGHGLARLDIWRAHARRS